MNEDTRAVDALNRIMPSDRAATDLAETDLAEAETDEGELYVSSSRYGGIPVLSAQGDIDLATVPALRDAVNSLAAELPDTGVPHTILLDLQKVGFIDSAGLALLVEVRKRWADVCRLTLLVERGSQPERVLKLGRFDTFVRILYTLDEFDTLDDTLPASTPEDS